MASPITGTGPLPLLGISNQAAADGVLVNVLDDLVGCVRVEDISILPRPGLPEMMVYAVSISHRQPLKKSRRLRCQPHDRLLAYRPFQIGQNRSHSILGPSRPDEHMDMFGHDDPSPEVERMFLSGSFNRLDQPVSAAVLAEQGHTLVTRERQEMSIARLIVVSDLLSRIWIRRRCHGSLLRATYPTACHGLAQAMVAP